MFSVTPTTLVSSHDGQSLLRQSPWDALLVILSVAHGLVLFAWPVVPVIGLGVWWSSNTIAHNAIHRPFFNSRGLNRLFAIYLSALLGIPQSLWRDRHLAHHASREARLNLNGALIIEILAVLCVWASLFFRESPFFLHTYLPGYAAGLGLCYLQGHYEHARGTISHYSGVYNFVFFNDGYHVEHHRNPGAHWTQLRGKVVVNAPTSPWPAVLRWLEAFTLGGLEKRLFQSSRLREFMLRTHEQAFRKLLPGVPANCRVAIVGGGLFPRTVMVLRKLLPEAKLVVVDMSAENIALARGLVGRDIEFIHDRFNPDTHRGFDVVVIPLALRGNRTELYRHPPAPLSLIHDWIWRPRGKSVVVSPFLLKRLNLVTS